MAGCERFIRRIASASCWPGASSFPAARPFQVSTGACTQLGALVRSRGRPRSPRDDGDEMMRYVGVLADISGLKEKEQRLAFLAEAGAALPRRSTSRPPWVPGSAPRHHLVGCVVRGASRRDVRAGASRGRRSRGPRNSRTRCRSSPGISAAPRAIAPRLAGAPNGPIHLPRRGTRSFRPSRTTTTTPACSVRWAATPCWSCRSWPTASSSAP